MSALDIEPQPGKTPDQALEALAADPSEWRRLIEALGAFDGERPDDAPVAPAPEQSCYVLLSPSWRVCGGVPDGLRRLSAMMPGVRSGIPFVPFEPENAEAFATATRAIDHGAARAVVRFFQGERPLFALLAAVAHLPTPWKRCAEQADSPAAAILFLPPLDEDAALWADVQDTFRLTVAEVRLSRLMKAGASPKAAAKTLGVSVNTVRFQLRSIFDKVGVNRQSDLILALTEVGRLTASIAAAPTTAPTARGGAYPAPSHRFFFTPDNRRIAYREYGDPGGRPAMLFHEGMGSSLALDGTDDAVRTLQLRLIIPDRPGFGLSSPLADYNFETVARDMAGLAQALNLRNVRLAGILSGGVHALATAAALGGDAHSVMLMSGRAAGAPQAHPPINPLRNFRQRLLRNPWVFRQLLDGMRLRVDHAFIARAMRWAASAPVDKARIQGRADYVDFGLAAFRDCLAISSQGPGDEIACFASGALCPMPTAPIRAWHGSDDAIAPLHELLEFLGPRLADLRTFEGSGHLLAMTHWREALTELAR